MERGWRTWRLELIRVTLEVFFAYIELQQDHTSTVCNYVNLSYIILCFQKFYILISSIKDAHSDLTYNFNVALFS